MLRMQPRGQLHPTFNILAGHQARILQNPGRGTSSSLPGYPGEDGDCPGNGIARGIAHGHQSAGGNEHALRPAAASSESFGILSWPDSVPGAFADQR